MWILRSILFFLGVFGFILLSNSNWISVPFSLPDGTVFSTKLPFLLLFAYLIGWLPTWIVHLFDVATKKNLQLRLYKAERELEEAVSGKRQSNSGKMVALPSQAQPTIVPPAGA